MALQNLDNGTGLPLEDLSSAMAEDARPIRRHGGGRGNS
jgi:hypothetical protein